MSDIGLMIRYFKERSSPTYYSDGKPEKNFFNSVGQKTQLMVE
nr:hypothetical protein [Hassalia byssoidea]